MIGGNHGVDKKPRFIQRDGIAAVSGAGIGDVADAVDIVVIDDVVGKVVIFAAGKAVPYHDIVRIHIELVILLVGGGNLHGRSRILCISEACQVQVKGIGGNLAFVYLRNPLGGCQPAAAVNAGVAPESIPGKTLDFGDCGFDSGAAYASTGSRLIGNGIAGRDQIIGIAQGQRSRGDVNAVPVGRIFIRRVAGDSVIWIGHAVAVQPNRITEDGIEVVPPVIGNIRAACCRVAA